MLNLFIVTGTVCNVPEVTQLADKNCVSFNLAVYQGKNKESVFFRCEVWSEFLKPMALSLSKGQSLCVSGSFFADKYVGKDGYEKQSLRIIANSLDKIERYYANGTATTYSKTADGTHKDAANAPQPVRQPAPQPAPQPAAAPKRADIDDLPF